MVIHQTPGVQIPPLCLTSLYQTTPKAFPGSLGCKNPVSIISPADHMMTRTSILHPQLSPHTLHTSQSSHLPQQKVFSIQRTDILAPHSGLGSLLVHIVENEANRVGKKRIIGHIEASDHLSGKKEVLASWYQRLGYSVTPIESSNPDYYGTLEKTLTND
jgi:hypothetical protein